MLGRLDTEDQLDKGRFFQKLHTLLKDNGYLDRYSAEETAILERAKSTPSSETAYAAGVVQERLGNYAAANEHYGRASGPDVEACIWKARSLHSLARIARYQEEWERADQHLTALEQLDPEGKFELLDDVAMERAHALLAHEKRKEAQKLLVDSLVEYPNSNRLGEMHYYAGVTYFFEVAKGKAYFHWWYVIKNLPEDRHHMRCFVSLGAQVFPFPNQELGGYAGAPVKSAGKNSNVRGQRMSIKGVEEWRDRTERAYDQLSLTYGRKFLPREEEK